MRCAWLRQIALAGFQRTEQQLQGWVHLHGIADYLLQDNWEQPPAQPHAELGDFLDCLRWCGSHVEPEASHGHVFTLAALLSI